MRGSDDGSQYTRPFDLARDIDQLSAAIDATPDCRLVIIDPVSAYMGRSDSHVNAEVRAVLAPLAELASEKRVAVVCVTHLRKGEGAAMYRAMGSLAFVAAARAAWAVVRDRNDQKRRLLLVVKNNLSGDVGTGLAYTVESHCPGGSPIVCWEPAPVTITADEALAPDHKKRGRPAEDREDAEAWLRGALAGATRPAKEVTQEASEAHCIAERTLDWARKTIGVVAYQPAIPGPWWWRLPDQPERRNSVSATPTHELWHSGNLGETPTFLDGSEGQIARAPQIQNVGVESSGNGHATQETESL